MGDFIKNNPFRFWCQKVLPLVYDDSLSYYELLCKVVGKLNELAENQNNLSDEIKAVAKDLDDFKAQVPGMVEAKVEEWLNNYIATHGLVNSVNGMTGAVVLKKLTAGEGLSMSGADGYNGSAEQSVGIAPGGVSSDKVADNAITEQKIANGAVTANKIAEGVIPTVSSFRKILSGKSVGLYIYITRVNDIYTVYAEADTTKNGSISPEDLNIDYPFEGKGRRADVLLYNENTGAIGGKCIFTFSENGCKVKVSTIGSGFNANTPYIGTALFGYTIL